MPVDRSVSRVLSFSAATYRLSLTSTPSSVRALLLAQEKETIDAGYVFSLQFSDLLMRTCEISLSPY
jgi:hypothetical protein